MLYYIAAEVDDAALAWGERAFGPFVVLLFVPFLAKLYFLEDSLLAFSC